MAIGICMDAPKDEAMLDAEAKGAAKSADYVGSADVDRTIYPSSGAAKSSGGLGMGVLAWLGFLTAMAIAALIMSAWATNKAIELDGRGYNTYLTSDPQEAISKGHEVYNVHAGSGYWARQEFQMAHPRSDAGVLTWDGEIYVFGGVSYDKADPGKETVLNNMTKYNMYTGTITEMPGMPEPRYRMGYAILDDMLYIFGGFNEVEGNTTMPVAETMVFNLKTMVWDPLGPSSPVMNFPRGDIGGAAAGGKVFATGGYNASNNYFTVNNVEVLDPATGRWTYGSAMVHARGDHRTVASGGNLYSIGGITTADQACDIGPSGDLWWECNEFTNTVEVLEGPSYSQWRRVASMVHPRGDFGATVLSNGDILVAGGECNYSRTHAGEAERRDNLISQQYTERYYPDVGLWVPKGPLFEQRMRFDMSADNDDFVYAFGGAPTCAETPDTCNLNVLSSIMAFNDINYHKAWVVQNN